MRHFFGIILISILSSTAYADVVFTPSWFYMKYEVETGGTTSESELTIYNIKLGKSFANGIYVGGVYDTEEINDDERTSIGLSGGYIKNGWNFHLTYFLKSEYTSGTSEFTGTGFNVEVGHVFDVGAWGIGPTLTYRTFTYDEVDGASLAEDVEYNRILPYLTFQFKF